MLGILPSLTCASEGVMDPQQKELAVARQGVECRSFSSSSFILTLFIIQGLYRDYTTPKRLKAPTLLLGSKKAAIKTRNPPPLKEALELVEAQAAIRATPRPPLCGFRVAEGSITSRVQRIQ